MEATINNASGVGAPRWRDATRFVFRLWSVYFAICLIPFTTVFIDGLGLWPRMVDAVGRWPIMSVLGLAEHSVGPRVPGTDFLPDYITFVVLALVSLVVATAWSVFDRRRQSYPRAFPLVYTAVRFVLAALMFWYGWAKILPGQFGLGVDLAYLPRPVAGLTPMNLLWAFMGASRPYAIFAGLLEFTGGLLLLTRRTAMFGALLSSAALVNVLMLNLAYDVNVKMAAGVMLAMALFLMAPHATRLCQMFLLNQPTHLAPQPPLFTNARVDRLARVVGILVAASAVYWAYGQAKVTADENIAAGKEPLYGVWMVEETVRNGLVAPPLLTDDTLWRHLIITGGAQIVWMSGSVTGYRLAIDHTAGTIDFRPRPQWPGTEPGRPMSFCFSQADPEHLELRGVSGDAAALVIRLRQVDLSRSPLVNHQHSWRW
jgi:hypothetical protein